MSLKDELVIDELGWGFNGPGIFNPGPDPMTDQEATDVLNAIHPVPNTRTRDRTSMTVSEVYNAIDQTGWAALSATEQQEVWDILHMGDVDPFGREATRFTAIFGLGSATIVALKAARLESVSRAVELGFGEVKSRHVGYARGA